MVPFWNLLLKHMWPSRWVEVKRDQLFCILSTTTSDLIGILTGRVVPVYHPQPHFQFQLLFLQSQETSDWTKRQKSWNSMKGKSRIVLSTRKIQVKRQEHNIIISSILVNKKRDLVLNAQTSRVHNQEIFNHCWFILWRSCRLPSALGEFQSRTQIFRL